MASNFVYSSSSFNLFFQNSCTVLLISFMRFEILLIRLIFIAAFSSLILTKYAFSFLSLNLIDFTFKCLFTINLKFSMGLSSNIPKSGIISPSQKTEPISSNFLSLVNLVLKKSSNTLLKSVMCSDTAPDLRNLTMLLFYHYLIVRPSVCFLFYFVKSTAFLFLPRWLLVLLAFILD